MHELSLTRSIVTTVIAQAEGLAVTGVRLRIGKLSGVEVDAIRFCFDVCAQGTLLEGAHLDIEEPPGQARCLECGETIALEQLAGRCPCPARARLAITGGEELLIHEIEVATSEV